MLMIHFLSFLTLCLPTRPILPCVSGLQGGCSSYPSRSTPPDGVFVTLRS